MPGGMRCRTGSTARPGRRCEAGRRRRSPSDLEDNDAFRLRTSGGDGGHGDRAAGGRRDGPRRRRGRPVDVDHVAHRAQHRERERAVDGEAVGRQSRRRRAQEALHRPGPRLRQRLREMRTHLRHPGDQARSRALARQAARPRDRDGDQAGAGEGRALHPIRGRRQEGRRRRHSQAGARPGGFPEVLTRKRRPTMPYGQRFRIWPIAAALLATLGAASGAWAEAEYKPLPAQQEKGDPVHIRVYHQPYYTQSWSSSVMKVKQFWKKYLPPGSTVTYEIALQGALAVNAIVADKAEYGYGGDAPSVLGMTQDRAKADIRGVWVNGYSNCCHCNVMIIAADAPYQKSPEDYVKWLQGKRAGGAKASCNDRWFRQVYQRFGVQPESHVHQSFEVTRTQFRVK